MIRQTVLPQLVGGLILFACLTFSLAGCKKKPKTMVSILPDQEVAAQQADLQQGTSLGIGAPEQDTQSMSGKLPAVQSIGPGFQGSLGNTAQDSATSAQKDLGIAELSLTNEQLSKAEFNADLQSVTFGYDSSELSAEMKTRLEKHLAFLDANPKLLCLLEGHTDEQGTAEYNYSLGNLRAQTVRTYLSENGISAERLFTVSYGEDRPIVDGSGETSYQENRRVDFLVMESE